MIDNNAAVQSRAKRLTQLQSKIFKVLKAGGFLYGYASLEGNAVLHRLLDEARNPVMLVKNRTFKALRNKQRIVRNEAGHWVAAKNKRRNAISNQSPDLPVPNSFSVVAGQLLFPEEQA